MYGNSALFALSILVFVASLLSGCSKGQETSKPPAKDPEVGVLLLQTQSVTLSNELPGRVTPLQIAEVRPQVTGIIQARLFQEGTLVKKGAPLYQIDAATYQAAVDTAQAQVAKAEATLATARSKSERGQALAERGLISRDSYDDLVTEQKQVEADVGVAQAALKAARINLTYTQVKAPISGFVGKSNVTAGALVTANQAATLTTIQQLDPIYVDMTEAGTALLQAKRSADAAVNVVLPDGTAYSHAGKLAFTDLSVDQSSGAVTVRAEIPNPEQQLLPGMFVRAKLGTAVKENALLVPQPSVSRKANGDAQVWVLGAENKLEQRVIKASQAVGDKWLVESGLNAGEKIVVDGLQKAKPGIVVKPLELDATGKPLNPPASPATKPEGSNPPAATKG